MSTADFDASTQAMAARILRAGGATITDCTTASSLGPAAQTHAHAAVHLVLTDPTMDAARYARCKCLCYATRRTLVTSAICPAASWIPSAA